MSIANVNSLIRQFAALSHPISKWGPQIQTVRWIKPRFKPIAKSKMFRVRQPTPIDAEENKQLKFLNNIYRTHMRSVRQYFRMQLQEKTKQAEMMKKTDFTEDIQEFEQLLKENDLWNEQVRKEREADMALEHAKDELIFRKKQEKYEQKKLELILLAEEKVLQEKDTVFITEKNLDLEIEKVIDSFTDYNFAIDKQGNIIRDESKLLNSKESKENEQIEKKLS